MATSGWRARTETGPTRGEGALHNPVLPASSGTNLGGCGETVRRKAGSRSVIFDGTVSTMRAG